MGVSGQHHAPAALYPPVPIVQEAGWAPEQVWTQRLKEISSASVGNRTPVVQSVVRHYTDWATPAPYTSLWKKNTYEAYACLQRTVFLEYVATNIVDTCMQNDFI
jgi:hypothetical protein